MKNISIKISTLHIDTNPVGFYMFSCDYFKAAKTTTTLDLGTRINYPAYFLYCRSLELILKSILLATKKYKLENLRKKVFFGHDIFKGLELLKKEWSEYDIIGLTSDDEKTIIDLNKWYKIDEKRFEYYEFPTGTEIGLTKTPKGREYPDLPSLGHLDELVNKFLNSRIKKFISES